MDRRHAEGALEERRRDAGEGGEEPASVWPQPEPGAPPEQPRSTYQTPWLGPSGSEPPSVPRSACQLIAPAGVQPSRRFQLVAVRSLQLGTTPRKGSSHWEPLAAATPWSTRVRVLNGCRVSVSTQDGGFCSPSLCTQLC